MCNHDQEKNYYFVYYFQGIRVPDSGCFLGSKPKDAVEFCVNELERLGIQNSISAWACDYGSSKEKISTEEAIFYLTHRCNLYFVERGRSWDAEYKKYIPTYFKIIHEACFLKWDERCLDCYKNYYEEHWDAWKQYPDYKFNFENNICGSHQK